MSISRLSSTEPNGASNTALDSFDFLLKHKRLIWHRILHDPVWFQYHGWDPNNIEDLVSDAIAFMAPHVSKYNPQFDPKTYISILLRRFRGSLFRQQAYTHALFMGSRGKGARISIFVRDHADLVRDALAVSNDDPVSITWAPRVGKNSGTERTDVFKRAALEEALARRGIAHHFAAGYLSVPLDQPFSEDRPALSETLASEIPGPDVHLMEDERSRILIDVCEALQGGTLYLRKPLRKAVLTQKLLPLARGSKESILNADLAKTLDRTRQAIDAAEKKVREDLRKALLKKGILEEDI